MITMLAFIAVLGLLIFVHELGHFLVAKWAGVRVEVFALGFGPRLFSFVRGDTEYCVCAVPLGGYVKMTGQDDMPGQSEGLTGADDEFPSKPWWKRLLIAAAGPAMNFVAAFFIFFGVYFFVGIPETVRSTDTTVEHLTKDYPAKELLQVGDRVESVNGEPVQLWEKMAGLIQKSEGETVRLSIRRGTAVQEMDVPVRVEDGVRRVGIGKIIPPIIGRVFESSQLPAENRQLRSGDKIVAIDALPITHWMELEEAIQGSAGEELVLRVERKEPFQVELLTSEAQGADLGAYGAQLSGENRVVAVAEGSKAEEAGLRSGDTVLETQIESVAFFRKLFRQLRGEDVQSKLQVTVKREESFDLAITPVAHPSTGQGLIGIDRSEQLIYHPYDLKSAVWAASVKFESSSRLVFDVLHGLITAKISPDNLAGPVGIMQFTGKQAEEGLMALLLFTGLLSVNLGIVNLLPIPILDGSHIVLCLWEGISRRPVSQRVQIVLQYVGLLLLIPLILYITFNDVVRWVVEVIG